MLDGKVGQAFDDERQERETTEGNRRVEEEIPPGYKDSDKLDSDNPERAAGDYLVWAQLIDEAARRQLDLVLVTGDVKEDWWERGPLGTLIGPRKELIAEFREKAAGRVHLLEPSAFLRASAALDVEINPLSVEDVERVRDETVPGPPKRSVRCCSGSKTKKLAQAEVIMAAADAGGRVERTDVYRITGRTDGRMLTGFTRPVARVTRELQVAGVVPEGVLPLLSSWYERGVRATHFIVPEEVVEMALR
ncbi:PIN-like domain-containing protein [Curtobacterium flaccumfaciens]|nr:PIN-like domain-containing protein [Curtobacterium flaccumfaciens]